MWWPLKRGNKIPKTLKAIICSSSKNKQFNTSQSYKSLIQEVNCFQEQPKAACNNLHHNHQIWNPSVICHTICWMFGRQFSDQTKIKKFIGWAKQVNWNVNQRSQIQTSERVTISLIREQSSVPPPAMLLYNLSAKYSLESQINWTFKEILLMLIKHNCITQTQTTEMHFT